MPLEKKYVILTDTTYIYVPIKAKQTPYGSGGWYCAGMPQFFGGTVHGSLDNPFAPGNYLMTNGNSGDNESTVKKEMGEESQEKFTLTGLTGGNILSCFTGSTPSYFADTWARYSFYHSSDFTINTGAVWSNDISLNNSTTLTAAKYKEMQAILRINKSAFNNIGTKTGTDNVILDYAKNTEIGGGKTLGDVYTQFPYCVRLTGVCFQKNSNDFCNNFSGWKDFWKDTGTKEAFEKFLKDHLG